MFTGIIQSVTPVLAVTEKEACLVARLKKPSRWKLMLGQSITVDGICSTVTRLGASFFEVEYMPETRMKTTAGTFTGGRWVNLERSLTLRDYIDGHLVSGHVDARGRVFKIATDENTKRISIEVPRALQKYIAKKGSVAVNGISLTVADVKKNVCTVALIPYTLEHTNLGLLKEGDSVNVEVDMVARYVERMLGEKKDRR
jgi:riboflavin synthase